MKLALFDFDGTISSKDSFRLFLIYAFGWSRCIIAFLILSPYLITYRLRLYSNQKAKEKVLTWFFRGWEYKKFTALTYQFSVQYLPKTIYQKALDQIRWHQKHGHIVVVVSASIEDWLKPWCDENKVKLIATKLEFKNELITGRFASENCYGEEKVRRIKEVYALEGFEYIYAYGDSSGDIEMLSLADERHYKLFT